MRFAVMLVEKAEHRRPANIGLNRPNHAGWASARHLADEVIQRWDAAAILNPGPRRRTTQTSPLWSRDRLLATPSGRGKKPQLTVQEPSPASPCSKSGSPAIFRLLRTFPGGVSPRSHSSQKVRSLPTSGVGLSIVRGYRE